MNKEELKETIENSSLLFYGEIEYCLDRYLPKFFSVETPEVGFDDSHAMNDLQYWLVVSWLTEMDMFEYGTSPRGGWLTEKGEQFKKYVLETEKPITSLMYKS